VLFCSAIKAYRRGRIITGAGREDSPASSFRSQLVKIVNKSAEAIEKDFLSFLVKIFPSSPIKIV